MPPSAGTRAASRTSSVAIVGDISCTRGWPLEHPPDHAGLSRPRVVGPKTLVPSGIADMGVRVTTTAGRRHQDADVVIMLRLQNERMRAACCPAPEYFRFNFGLGRPSNACWPSPMPSVMHPGPINRGVEIESAVADGPQSVILNQVTFGIAIRMAVPCIVDGHERPGRPASTGIEQN